MRPIDLSKLRLFYEIAREGNLTRAAEKLNISQPALSRILIIFEDRLKTKLFERLPNGMRLTPDGERLYNHAKIILEAHDSFERQFYDKEGEIAGEIKIVTTPFVGSEWLVPHLQGFLDKYPKVKIKVLLRSEDLDLIEGDVAICLYRPPQPYFIQEHLFTTNIRLFASPSYLKKFSKPDKPEDLDHHRLITYRGNYYSSYGSTNWVLNVGRQNSTLPRESYFEIDSLYGMFNGALQGMGITELPDYPNILNSGLVDIFPNLSGPETSMYYVFSERKKSSKKIKLLLKYLQAKGK